VEALDKVETNGRDCTRLSLPLLVEPSHSIGSHYKQKALIYLSTLNVVPKSVRLLSRQHPNESCKLWEHVASNSLKEFGEATRVKLAIKQKQ
jgi:hypothetical protein